MKTATQQYIEDNYLRVPKFVIERAIKNMSKLEAIVLIRGAFTDEAGSWVSLEEAKTIYKAIIL